MPDHPDLRYIVGSFQQFFSGIATGQDNLQILRPAVQKIRQQFLIEKPCPDRVEHFIQKEQVVIPRRHHPAHQAEPLLVIIFVRSFLLPRHLAAETLRIHPVEKFHIRRTLQELSFTRGIVLQKLVDQNLITEARSPAAQAHAAGGFPFPVSAVDMNQSRSIPYYTAFFISAGHCSPPFPSQTH